MRFAVLSQDEKYVENVIVADASQQEELETAPVSYTHLVASTGRWWRCRKPSTAS